MHQGRGVYVKRIKLQRILVKVEGANTSTPPNCTQMTNPNERHFACGSPVYDCSDATGTIARRLPLRRGVGGITDS